ncbi:MAG: transglutaminase-like cysteine peptidase [Pseudomonadota bacterium]
MRIFLVSALVFWSLLGSAAASVFGSGETAYQDLTYFPKWTGMIQRSLSGDIGTPTSPKRGNQCKPNPRFLCPQDEWESFIEYMQAQEAKGLQQLKDVNAHLNRARYVQDPINWGVSDFWAHLLEFFDRNGDCEDYAIAKYATLKRLGIPTKAMRIVVLEDLNLDLAHAVLVVEQGGRTYVLDNQVSAVLPDDAIAHYRPVYSINEHGWWMHGSPGALRPGR